MKGKRNPFFFYILSEKDDNVSKLNMFKYEISE